jgi:hypothetical protein
MASTKTISKDQFKDLKSWLDFHKEHGKLPYGEILCCKCKTYYAKLKGAGMQHAMKAAESNVEKMLTSTLCKDCRFFYRPNEKKVVVKRIKTQEEIDEEIERIRKDLPKIDFNAPKNIINLNKDKEACARETRDMCIRPDVYLDNDKTCDYCNIKEHCSCPLKRFLKKKSK